jgi:hypothetical protein
MPADYLPNTLPAIFNEAALRRHAPAKPRLLRDTWLPDTRIMAARCHAESANGLYLACIASDNGKSHSHNDTGSFWVYANGLPVLIDLGQETYQKKSFDSHRYEIPSTQSSFHNLPTIGGVDQGVGPQFRATDIAYKADDAAAQLAFELRDAYPRSARVKSWIRTVRLARSTNEISIADTYQLDGPAADVTLNLMTPCVVAQSAGELSLGRPDGSKCGVLVFDPKILSAKVEIIPLNNEELNQNWGAEVYRIRLTTSKLSTSGTATLQIRGV